MRVALAVLMLGGCVWGVGCGSSGSPATTGNSQLRTFRMPSASMEPTLNCGKPAPGCLGTADDHVLIQPGKSVKRGDIVVFRAPSKAAEGCGMSGVFIKRVIGLPGDTVHEDGQGFIDINGKRLTESYVSRQGRIADSMHFAQSWHVPPGEYFLLGDNRGFSCDSRSWGSVPQSNIIGPVVKIIHMH